jgi:hypothetical protein
MKPATLPRSRFGKEGTRWLHREGIFAKRAFGFSGEELPTIFFSNWARLTPRAVGYIGNDSERSPALSLRVWFRL